MGLISRVSSRTYRHQIQKMFRAVTKIRAFIPKNRQFSTSSFLRSDGDKIAENEKAREDQYFYELQKKQFAALKKKTQKIQTDLENEVEEIEGQMATLKSQLNKKKNQLDD